MNVFISHSTIDYRLAEAWKKLLESIAPGSIHAWYSSDRRPHGGIDSGKWKERLGEELDKADNVLAIFTPESVNRPWIVFETAYALGLPTENTVIPILYYMDVELLPSPLADLQIYYGDEEESVRELCERLFKNSTGRSPDETILGLWQSLMTSYLEEVAEHRNERLRRALFYGDFHTPSTAKKLQGEWTAKWTKFREDGTETLWQIQPMVVEPVDWRIRMVGEAAQGVLSPFEGVVSSTGRIALSYWVQGESSICGTVLLELHGTLLLGEWQGYTARSLRQRPELVRGRVVMSRSREEAEKFDWGSPPGS